MLILASIYLLIKYFRGKNGLPINWKANLKGKIAIITGGNTGMGLQTAIALAKMVRFE